MGGRERADTSIDRVRDFIGSRRDAKQQTASHRVIAEDGACQT
jgi:hypothetical protein